MRRYSMILVLGLAGCQTSPPSEPVLPAVVRVPVPTYVAVPAELTRDCDEVVKQGNTYGEAVRLANSRKAALDECTARMREIRALQPPDKKP
ncbi:hypothetical protein [Lysobacter sp. ESA13C]|uniref:Rz1-like lysis system protein LysC n=1 Tax=Lysobacter sp. ESA13C TaxID=2862676 RepID=UPI001CBD5598|nr:hypothetical protein [Lysobacter sp. ESA13C]